MINLDSIANKLRLSYFIFAVLLCATFVGIFYAAEKQIEGALVQSRLIQQLQLSQQTDGKQRIYTAEPGITIYQFAQAPAYLQQLAKPTVQEMTVNTNHKDNELHFFEYEQDGQRYILTYLEETMPNNNNYPVLAIFEHFEVVFYTTIWVAVIISLLIAFLFSYLSSKAIIKPLLDLKQAVETDHQNLTELTHIPSEVGILARTIEEKNHKLTEYLNREQLFTGDVSHELRTPLTIIMGAAEVLDAQLPSDSKLHEFTQRINTTATETSEIITALLLLSRAPEKLDAPLTTINSIANSEIERLGYLLRHKPVISSVVATQAFTANVRPELLKMALGNLIKNAFQYTEAGTVTVTIDDQTITVTDTGIGISNEMMPMLYERFERGTQNKLDNQMIACNLVGGCGLGLSIVQRIMTHLGWTLTHQNNNTGGNTFIIHYRSK